MGPTIVEGKLETVLQGLIIILRLPGQSPFQTASFCVTLIQCEDYWQFPQAALGSEMPNMGKALLLLRLHQNDLL